MAASARSSARALCAIGLVLTVGCSGGSDETATTLPASASIESIAEALDCTETADLHTMVAPIRGGAATAGSACDTPSGSVHLFARAPEGTADGSGADQGGTIANIDRLVGADTSDDACPVDLLVGRGYFALSDAPTALALVARTAGHVERPDVPAAPRVSYLAPPCSTSVEATGTL